MDFSVAGGAQHQVKRHMETKSHEENAKQLPVQPPISRLGVADSYIVSVPGEVRKIHGIWCPRPGNSAPQVVRYACAWPDAFLFVTPLINVRLVIQARRLVAKRGIHYHHTLPTKRTWPRVDRIMPGSLPIMLAHYAPDFCLLCHWFLPTLIATYLVDISN